MGRVDPSRPKPEDQPDRVFGIKHPNTYHKFVVLCLDRSTGEEVWRQTATERVPHEGTHNDADFAPASPTTDGKRLYCWFGSAGMCCYDLNGKKLWKRDLGKAYVSASLGEGCSPVVHDARVVIVRDHDRQSTIEVLDARSGETIWGKNRDEGNAWATPRVIQHSGRTQVITSASNMVRSYDLDNGEVIWQCSGLTENCIPCPVVNGDLVYCMSGYKGYSLLALPLTERGDISDSDKIVWSKDRGTPYVPSPLLYDGMLYFSQSNGNILSCLDSKSGDTVLQQTRLPGLSNVYASPVGADGRVYFTGRDGTTLVLKRSNELEVLATNELNDTINASPAIAGDQLFLRGRKSLYCLEDRKDAVEQSAKAVKGAKGNAPNVLFLAVDDLNDWVGCLGGHPQAKTPNIDHLAEKGVLFEQAYCGAPLCSPSRTAIMTGLRPSTTGIYGNLAWFRDIPKHKDWETIPQYFRKHGYMAFGGGKLYHMPDGKFSDPIAWDKQYSTKMGTP